MRLAKIFTIVCLVFFNNLYAALGMVINPAANPPNMNMDLGYVNLDSGFYGSPPGNVDISIIGKNAGSVVEVSTYITQELRNVANPDFIIPEGYLQWKIYWASTDGSPNTGVDASSSAGFNSWVPYRLDPDRVLLVNSATTGTVSITLGTTIKRIPAVQPLGRYTTRIVYTVTQQ